MEIREQKSPFEACGKDAVQEWLVHPVTIAMRIHLMGTVESNERQGIAAMREFCQGVASAELVGIAVKNMGSVLLGLDEAVNLFDSAKDYANGK